jgi:hypothetical protein
MDNSMVHAVIHDGRIEPQGPIPDSWEGQVVKLVPLTPDDAVPDFEQRLAALHALGPIELDPDERVRVGQELQALDELSKRAMSDLSDFTRG